MKKNDAKKSKLTLNKDTIAHLVTKTGVQGGIGAGNSVQYCVVHRNTQPSQCPVCYK